MNIRLQRRPSAWGGWLRIAFATTAIFALPTAASSAPVTWYLNQVVFDDGGTATGSFVFDAATGQYSSFNIATTPGTTRPGAIYGVVAPNPGFASSTLVGVIVGPFATDYTGRTILAMPLSSTMTGTGGTIALVPGTPQFLNEGICGNAACTFLMAGPARAVTGGWVTTQICSYSFTFDPASTTLNLGPSGDTGSVTLVTQSGCPWNASSSLPWLSIVNPTGSGPGVVSINVPANVNDATRTGTILIAGIPVRVSQPSNCSYILSPPSPASIPANAVTRTIAISTASGCLWTAVSNSNFISVTSLANGTGSGFVNILIQPNPNGLERSGTLTLAGQTYTVTQSAVPCSSSVTPSALNFQALGAGGTITVITAGGCTWTAASNFSWITITNTVADPTGIGAVNFTVATNPDPSQRTGTLTVAGQTVTITQSGGSCVYNLSSTSTLIPGAGGNGSVNVSTTSSCQWTATSPISWVTVTGGANGTGNGTVTVNALPNPNSTPRSAVLAVAGQFFTVNQSAGQACTYTLSSPSGSISSNGGILNVTLTTGPTCSWLAVAPEPWTTISSGLTGTGSTIVTLNVVSNPSASPRTSTVTIAGQTFLVSQGGTQIGGVSPPLRFVALDSCRVMETRPEYNFQGRTGAFGPPYLRANETRTLNLPFSNVCQIPASAKAYLVNVTLVPKAGVDFVTLYPTGDSRPQVWTVRSPDAQIVANSAIVKAGVNNSIDVFASNDTDLLIDIAGYFTDNPNFSNLVFYPMTPCRVVDSRFDYRNASGAYGPPSLNARETRRIRFPGTPFCQIPAGAAAYSVTITAVPQGALQYLTAWASGGAQPNVSSINSPAGRVLANSVILPTSSDGSIDVFAFDRTDFLIDINGYFAPDDGVNGLFYFPITQCRAADSTSLTLTGAFGGPIYEAQVARTLAIPNSPGCSSIPATAKAYFLNVTALPNGAALPFITAYPTGQPRPNASILNAFQGQIVTNSAIVPAGPNGAIDIYPYGNRTNVVVEISGYFGR